MKRVLDLYMKLTFPFKVIVAVISMLTDIVVQGWDLMIKLIHHLRRLVHSKASLEVRLSQKAGQTNAWVPLVSLGCTLL